MSDFIDPAYGGLDLQLRNLLVRNGWNRATVLSEAIETTQDVFDMLHVMSGGHETDHTLERWARRLVRWKLEVEPQLKRVRARIAHARPEERMLALRAIRGVQLPGIPLSHPLLQKVLFVKVHWKSRRSARLGRAKDPNSRKAIEVLERERWGGKIAEALILADAPVCSQAALAGNPMAALMGMINRKRSRTLRARYKAWVKIRLWLNCNFDVEWPQHVGHMLDYLHDLENSGCPKSTPVAVSGGLGYMEKVGGFLQVQCISFTVLWRDNVNGLKLRLQEESGGTIVCKAPQPFVSQLISMELYIVSGRSLFKRAFC